MNRDLTDAEYRELLAFRTNIRRFLQWSEEQATALGITPAQHQLLLAVRGHDGASGPTIGDVAESLLLRHHSAVELAREVLKMSHDNLQELGKCSVGELMKIGIQKGRDSRKAKHGQHLKVGICGEHGGDPDSVVFCHSIGMDYVSCSPFRVPIARLAAAQAALGETKRDK